jgi:RNA polymerase sigma-32 factor
VAPIAYLADMHANPAAELEDDEWETHNSDRLHRALADLDERSRDIVARRWLAESKSTLHELADQYQVSAERIRQLESNAMKKLRTALEA